MASGRRGAAAVVLALALLVAVVMAVGGRSDHDVTIDGVVVAAVDIVDIHSCPGVDDVIGQLAGGQAVLVTGRTGDGTWLQLESPTDDVGTAWVDAEVVSTTDPEDDPAALPIARCGDVAFEFADGEAAMSKGLVALPPGGGEPETDTTTTTTAPGATTTTTTTAPSGPAPTAPSTQPTSRPATPPTTRPAPPTTRPTTTTTTRPPDLSPPSVSEITASRVSFNEDGPGCPNPRGSDVTALIRDPSGIARAWVTWQILDRETGVLYAQGATDLVSIGGDRYQARVGQFQQPLPPGRNGTVTWRVRAVDGAPAGNAVNVAAPEELRFSLRNC